MQPLVLRKHAKNFFNLFLEVICQKFPVQVFFGEMVKIA